MKRKIGHWEVVLRDDGTVKHALLPEAISVKSYYPYWRLSDKYGNAMRYESSLTPAALGAGLKRGSIKLIG